MRLFACDRMLATAAIAVAVSLSASLPAASAGIEYPYCLMPGRFLPQSCTFTTLAQCQASQAPGSGPCEKNPRYVASKPQSQQHPRHRR